MSNNNINMSSKGKFSICVLDKDGKVKKEKSIGNTLNVVTYEGAYTALIKTYDSVYGVYYANMGTGTTELTRSSTSLGSAVSGNSSTDSVERPGSEIDNLDGTSTLTLSRTFSFTLGSKVGTFSEVGVFDGSVLIAGQLIKDEFGSPTTITVLSDEQLVVTYILEWIVPNKSQLIGTGTLTDENSNTYEYEVYSQPYFTEYTLNDSNKVTRYNANSSTSDEIGFYAADGLTSLYDTGDLGDGFYNNVVHDGLGTVTFTTNAEVFSPSQGAWTGLTYLSFYSVSSNVSTAAGVDDIVTNTAPSTSYSRYPLLLKFVDPLSKTSSQSFEITASFTVTL